jgi:hypothetical protein
MFQVRTMGAAFLMSGLMSGLLAVVFAPAANAQANCDWYGTTAIKQQQENEKFKCGFAGAAWSSDLKAHLTWCGNVAPDVWKAAAQQRDQELAACAAKK